VSCPINNVAFAVGQLAVFQGASEVPLSESYGSREQRGKTANWPRPEGWDENGPAAVPQPRDRLRINLDMRPPRALPTAHFDRNESHVIYGTGH
jgi:hypothetical protein